MQVKSLGRSGLQVSAVGLGCNNFGMRIDEARATEVVHAALDAGITLFDTADMYGAGQSERMLGTALGKRRYQVVIATKFGFPVGPDSGKGASRRHIMNAVEASLTRLGTDYIDLYQIHSPDPATPIEETLRALDDLVRAGKVRYIGCSNFKAWQVADAAWIARTTNGTAFVSDQVEYSLMERRVETELAPACRRFGLGVLPYFPLANGLLTGKYADTKPEDADTRLVAWGDMGAQVLTESNLAIVARLRAFAEERGRSLLEVAMGWLVSNDVVSSVIAGATRPDQVKANVAAGLAWTPTDADRAALDAIVPPGRRSLSHPGHH